MNSTTTAQLCASKFCKAVGERLKSLNLFFILLFVSCGGWRRLTGRRRRLFREIEMVVTSRSRQIFRFRRSGKPGMPTRTFNMYYNEITAINFVSQESRMSLINARKNRVHWPVHHSPPQFWVFKAALFISICLKIRERIMQRIRSDLGRHMFTPRVLMDRKPPLKSRARQTQSVYKKN